MMNSGKVMSVVDTIHAMQQEYLQCAESDPLKASQIEKALKRNMKTGASILGGHKEETYQQNKTSMDEPCIDRRVVVKNRATPRLSAGREKLDLQGKLQRWITSFEKHPDVIFEELAMEYEGNVRITAPCIHRSFKYKKIPLTKRESFRIMSLFDKNGRGCWMKDEFLGCCQQTVGPVETAKQVARHSDYKTPFQLTVSQTLTVGKLSQVMGTDKVIVGQLFKELCAYCGTMRLTASDIYKTICGKYQCISVDLVSISLLVQVFDETNQGLNKAEFLRMFSPIYRLDQYTV